MHGAFHGGWCWRRVGDRLQKAGRRVFAPTLTGLGERRHLLTREVDVDTHIQDVIALIEAEELENVVLVGHSYAGIVITGVAERAAKRIRQLVYLDSLILEDGEAWLDVYPAEVGLARRKAAAEASGGLFIPAPKAEYFGVEERDDRGWVDRRVGPHPFATYEQKMHWRRPVGNDLPEVYIDCTSPALAALASVKERYRGRSGWPFIEMKTGHDAMVTAPEETAQILLRYA